MKISKKHKHIDKVVAKVHNMDLVVFYRESNTGSLLWRERTNKEKINFNPRIDYFLCLPKHSKECLHWLNGGTLQLGSSGVWSRPSDIEWTDASPFMDEQAVIVTKLRKGKLWVAFNHKNGNVYGTFPNRKECTQCHPEHQPIEITVEEG